MPPPPQKMFHELQAPSFSEIQIDDIKLGSWREHKINEEILNELTK
jgi:hypothetical protein